MSSGCYPHIVIPCPSCPSTAPAAQHDQCHTAAPAQQCLRQQRSEMPRPLPERAVLAAQVMTLPGAMLPGMAKHTCGVVARKATKQTITTMHHPHSARAAWLPLLPRTAGMVGLWCYTAIHPCMHAWPAARSGDVVTCCRLCRKGAKQAVAVTALCRLGTKGRLVFARSACSTTTGVAGQ
jgi:hypothetical protein